MKINNLDPFHMSDKDIKETDKAHFEIFVADRARWNRLYQTAKQLGLSGLWRGGQATIVILDKLVKDLAKEDK